MPKTTIGRWEVPEPGTPESEQWAQMLEELGIQSATSFNLLDNNILLLSCDDYSNPKENDLIISADQTGFERHLLKLRKWIGGSWIVTATIGESVSTDIFTFTDSLKYADPFTNKRENIINLNTAEGFTICENNRQVSVGGKDISWQPNYQRLVQPVIRNRWTEDLGKSPTPWVLDPEDDPGRPYTTNGEIDSTLQGVKGLPGTSSQAHAICYYIRPAFDVYAIDMTLIMHDKKNATKWWAGIKDVTSQTWDSYSTNINRFLYGGGEDIVDGENYIKYNETTLYAGRVYEACLYFSDDAGNPEPVTVKSSFNPIVGANYPTVRKRYHEINSLVQPVGYDYFTPGWRYPKGHKIYTTFGYSKEELSYFPKDESKIAPDWHPVEDGGSPIFNIEDYKNIQRNNRFVGTRFGALEVSDAVTIPFTDLSGRSIKAHIGSCTKPTVAGNNVVFSDSGYCVGFQFDNDEWICCEAKSGNKVYNLTPSGRTVDLEASVASATWTEQDEYSFKWNWGFYVSNGVEKPMNFWGVNLVDGEAIDSWNAAGWKDNGVDGIVKEFEIGGSGAPDVLIASGDLESGEVVKVTSNAGVPTASTVKSVITGTVLNIESTSNAAIAVTANVYESAMAVITLPGTDKTILFYKDATGTKALSGSGDNSLSFSNEITIMADVNYSPSDFLEIDSDRFVVAFNRSDGTNDYTSYKIFSVAGDLTITEGSTLIDNTGYGKRAKLGLVGPNRVVSVYPNSLEDSLYAVTMTLSGNTMTLDGNTTNLNYDPNDNSYLDRYGVVGNGEGKFMTSMPANGSGHFGICTVVGNTITPTGDSFLGSMNYPEFTTRYWRDNKAVLLGSDGSSRAFVVVDISGSSPVYKQETVLDTQGDYFQMGFSIYDGNKIAVSTTDYNNNRYTTVCAINEVTDIVEDIVTPVLTAVEVENYRYKQGDHFGRVMSITKGNNIVSVYRPTENDITYKTHQVENTYSAASFKEFHAVTQEAALDGSPVEIVYFGGRSKVHTGLTPGATAYYHTGDGSIDTASTGSNEYPIGLAISDTDIELDDINDEKMADKEWVSSELQDALANVASDRIENADNTCSVDVSGGTVSLRSFSFDIAKIGYVASEGGYAYLNSTLSTLRFRHNGSDRLMMGASGYTRLGHDVSSTTSHCVHTDQSLITIGAKSGTRTAIDVGVGSGGDVSITTGGQSSFYGSNSLARLKMGNNRLDINSSYARFYGRFSQDYIYSPSGTTSGYVYLGNKTFTYYDGGYTRIISDTGSTRLYGPNSGNYLTVYQTSIQSNIPIYSGSHLAAPTIRRTINDNSYISLTSSTRGNLSFFDSSRTRLQVTNTETNLISGNGSHTIKATDSGVLLSGLTVAGSMRIDSNQLYKTNSATMYLNYSGSGETVLGNASYASYVPKFLSVNNGTATPTQALTVRQNSNLKGIRILGPSNSSYFWDIGAYSNTDQDLAFSANNTIQGYINYGDGVWTTSDRRVKENFEAVPETALGNFMKLKTHLGHYKRWDIGEDGEKVKVDNTGRPKSLMFIAQEVQELFPNMVKEKVDHEGQPILTMGYSSFDVLTVKVVQDMYTQLTSEIASLKEEIATLKGV